MRSPSRPKVSLSSLSSLISLVFVAEFWHIATTYLEKIWADGRGREGTHTSTNGLRAGTRPQIGNLLPGPLPGHKKRAKKKRAKKKRAYSFHIYRLLLGIHLLATILAEWFVFTKKKKWYYIAQHSKYRCRLTVFIRLKLTNNNQKKRVQKG